MSQTHLDKISIIEPLPTDHDSLYSDVADLLEVARRNDRHRLFEKFDSMELGYASPVPKVHDAAVGGILRHNLIPTTRTPVSERHDASG